MEEQKPWTMPEWMKPYEPLMTNTGGNEIEWLIAQLDRKSLAHVNLVLFTLATSVACQVGMLERLHSRGLLAEPGKWQYGIRTKRGVVGSAKSLEEAKHLADRGVGTVVVRRGLGAWQLVDDEDDTP